MPQKVCYLEGKQLAHHHADPLGAANLETVVVAGRSDVRRFYVSVPGAGCGAGR